MVASLSSYNEDVLYLLAFPASFFLPHAPGVIRLNIALTERRGDKYNFHYKDIGFYQWNKETKQQFWMNLIGIKNNYHYKWTWEFKT